MHAAVVKLDALADAVGATPQDQHLAAGFRLHLRFGWQRFQPAVVREALNRPLVAGVVVRRAGGKFGGAGVHRFEQGIHPEGLAMAAHREFIAAGGPGDLAVGEAQLLELQQGVRPQISQLAAA